MAITFPITLPSGGIREIDWIQIDAVGGSPSPYTFSEEVFEHAGKRWGIEVQLVAMKPADAAPWNAAFGSLRGRRGTFYFGPTAAQAQRGALSGTPLIKGASQTGGTILIDGCGNGVVNWIRKDDWLQIGTGLHQSLVDADSNGSGEVTLELWPGPRTAPADNAAVTVASPKGIFRLVSNERRFNITLAKMFGRSFAAYEAF